MPGTGRYSENGACFALLHWVGQLASLVWPGQLCGQGLEWMISLSLKVPVGQG